VPRYGPLALADVRSPTVSALCECGQSDRYAVASLIVEYGDAKLTDLICKLADCQTLRSSRSEQRCKAVYEGGSLSWL
jgi:hypothetical protein